MAARAFLSSSNDLPLTSGLNLETAWVLRRLKSDQIHSNLYSRLRQCLVQCPCLFHNVHGAWKISTRERERKRERERERERWKILLCAICMLFFWFVGTSLSGRKSGNSSVLYVKFERIYSYNLRSSLYDSIWSLFRIGCSWLASGVHLQLAFVVV